MTPQSTQATAAIIAMWLSVMLIGIFVPYPQINEKEGTGIPVPVGAVCAPCFAAIAMVFVALWDSRGR